MRERSYLRSMGELKWCPGCGHWSLLGALNRSLGRLDLPENRIVIVTDIGCIGLADRFFTTNAFHGLHGRSVSYATGLKLARPELTVIVLMGDGGCGIGGTHIVNAARRNVGITVIVGNNLNYGMTGCQQSVTTPECGITETSPWGNIEAPLDICGLGRAGRAGWIGRIASTKENRQRLEEMLVEAISHDGFSLLDVWEVCTGAYAKRNPLDEDGLMFEMHRTGLNALCEVEPRPEFSREYRTRIIGPNEGISISKADLTPRYSSEMTRKTSIIVAGSAGQAVQSAATIFGAGAILSGLYATQRNTYPITRQSGHSIAEVIISPKKIEYTGIDVPDHLIILSKEGSAEMKDAISLMGRTGYIIAAAGLGDRSAPEGPKLITVPDPGEMGLAPQSMALMTLSVLLGRTGLFPPEALMEAIGLVGAEKYISPNIGACESGISLRVDG